LSWEDTRDAVGFAGGEPGGDQVDPHPGQRESPVAGEADHLRAAVRQGLADGEDEQRGSGLAGVVVQQPTELGGEVGLEGRVEEQDPAVPERVVEEGGPAGGDVQVRFAGAVDHGDGVGDHRGRNVGCVVVADAARVEFDCLGGEPYAFDANVARPRVDGQLGGGVADEVARVVGVSGDVQDAGFLQVVQPLVAVVVGAEGDELGVRRGQRRVQGPDVLEVDGGG